jgi:hypothetical protein
VERCNGSSPSPWLVAGGQKVMITLFSFIFSSCPLYTSFLRDC